MQGLTGGGGGDRRVEYILPEEWRNEYDARHVFFLLAGLDLILAAYRDAIAREFQFYSYGDAMLIV